MMTVIAQWLRRPMRMTRITEILMKITIKLQHLCIKQYGIGATKLIPTMHSSQVSASFYV